MCVCVGVCIRMCENNAMCESNFFTSGINFFTSGIMIRQKDNDNEIILQGIQLWSFLRMRTLAWAIIQKCVQYSSISSLIIFCYHVIQ